MAQKRAEPLSDGKPQSHALAALTGLIADLMIFFEYCLQGGFWDADTGVPNLYPGRGSDPPTADQDLTGLGIFQRVRDQIAQDLFQQPGITDNIEIGLDDPKLQTFGMGEVGELIGEPRH